MIKDIHGFFRDVYFCVRIPDSGLMLIEGDSSTGKTFFYEACDNSLKFKFNMRCYTKKSDKEDIESKFATDTNKIFVLDRTDTWLTDSMCDSIMENSENYYIIIGRYVTGIMWNSDEIIQLHTESNIIYSSNISMQEVLNYKAEDEKEL